MPAIAGKFANFCPWISTSAETAPPSRGRVAAPSSTKRERFEQSRDRHTRHFFAADLGAVLLEDSRDDTDVQSHDRPIPILKTLTVGEHFDENYG